MSQKAPFDDADTRLDQNSPEKHSGIREWLRVHFISRRGPDDDAILQTTGELIDQLSLGLNAPAAIRWNDRIQTGKNSSIEVHSDFPRLRWGSLFIAERMIGRLRADEWKPLIASSLLYQKGPIAHARTITGWKRAGLPFATIALSFLVGSYLVLSSLWGTSSPYGALLPFVATVLLFVPVLIASAIIGTKLENRISQASWLEADTKTAEVLGREGFLGTLMKIDGMGIKDVEKLKRGRFFSEWPSITRRIENLQSYGSPQSY